MQGNISSILSAVPSVFADNGIEFDGQGRPILTVNITGTEKGEWNITTSPSMGNSAWFYHRNPFNGSCEITIPVELLDPRKVYTLKFAGNDILSFTIDGIETGKTNDQNTRFFLGSFYDDCCRESRTLADSLLFIPPVGRIIEILRQNIDVYLMDALACGDSDVFVNGPTCIKLISPLDVSRIIHNLLYLTLNPGCTAEETLVRHRVILSEIRREKNEGHTLVMLKGFFLADPDLTPSFDMNHPFLETIGAIITDCINALLADAVRQKKREILSRIDPIFIETRFQLNPPPANTEEPNESTGQ